MGLRANLRQFRKDHSGAALVEFTLLAPMLVALMCGLAEFGLALRQYHVMEKGVRDAARYLSRVPANPPCVAADPNWATYVTQAKNLAIYGVTTTGCRYSGAGRTPPRSRCRRRPAWPILASTARICPGSR